jgi:SAM-dependent methyltransferase
VVVLVKPEELADWGDRQTVTLQFRADALDHHFRKGCIDPGFLEELRARSFASVIVPSIVPKTWRDNALEVLAAEISEAVEVASRDGKSWRRYEGEYLHRLIYNKAYLTSMLSFVPNPAGAERVLEVGCSDGLACDILVQLGAGRVYGVDLWTENVGSEFASERTEFSRDDATRLSFPDQHFDLVYSIATFEHLLDPWRVMEEMYRVTKIGGCMYIQAGPLYHSPFGHHMFSCFADLPWAHLRLTEAELVAHIHDTGKAAMVQAQTGQTPADYVHGMLGREHINGLFLEQYRLAEFAQATGAEILHLGTSYEGRDLLTPSLQAELSTFTPESLVEHGFEFCIRRTM